MLREPICQEDNSLNDIFNRLIDCKKSKFYKETKWFSLSKLMNSIETRYYRLDEKDINFSKTDFDTFISFTNYFYNHDLIIMESDVLALDIRKYFIINNIEIITITSFVERARSESILLKWDGIYPKENPVVFNSRKAIPISL